MDRAEEQRYVDADRGDRLHPGRLHPRCWHLRLLRQRLQSVVDSELLAPGEILVDYGCANKPYEGLFRTKFNRYVGADLPGNVNAELIVGPEGRLPLEDESVDCVFSSQVLEHVADPRIYLAEAYRILRQDGSLVLSTHGVWRYHPDPTDHWRWTIAGLQLELCRAGFEVLLMYGIFGLASTAIQLWQDATYGKVPRVIRPVYVGFLQSIIGVVERWHPEELSKNASVFVVLGRKTARPLGRLRVQSPPRDNADRPGRQKDDA